MNFSICSQFSWKINKCKQSELRWCHLLVAILLTFSNKFIWFRGNLSVLNYISFIIWNASFVFSLDVIASLGLGVSVMDNINTRSTKHLKIDDDGLYHQRHYYIDLIWLGCFSNILIEVLLGLEHSYIQYRQK